MHRILIVDDDPNILSGYRRHLRGSYKVTTTESGESGLKAIGEVGPFAVIVADMQMPGMNGTEFLIEAKKIAPMSVRVMLTGNVDQETAINAINQGNIFKFIGKPCPPEGIRLALETCIEHYNLVTAEQELTQKTLAGSIKVLLDVVSFVDPNTFGRSRKVREWAVTVARSLGLAKSWHIDMAAMLAPIGRVTLPPDINIRLMHGGILNGHERAMYERVPEISQKLIVNIPRLETVAEIVLYHDKNFDGSGFPKDSRKGDAIPLESRILKILYDLGDICDIRQPDKNAFNSMMKRKGRYDPALLSTIKACLCGVAEQGGAPRHLETFMVPPEQLQPGDHLVTDVETETGSVIISAGDKVSAAQAEILRSLAKTRNLKGPVKVLRPVTEKAT